MYIIIIIMSVFHEKRLKDQHFSSHTFDY